MIRIFRATPEYVVVSADYESSGELASLDIGGVKNGNWINTSIGGTSYHLQAADPRLRTYGIPSRLTSRSQIPTGSLLPELTVMVYHFAYDKIIQLDELHDGAVVSSRFLQPSVTTEEQTLNPICEAKMRIPK